MGRAAGCDAERGGDAPVEDFASGELADSEAERSEFEHPSAAVFRRSIGHFGDDFRAGASSAVTETKCERGPSRIDAFGDLGTQSATGTRSD